MHEHEFESALKALRPAGGRINLVSAAFAAGKRSQRREVRLWRTAAALIILMGAMVRLIPGRHDVAMYPRETASGEYTVLSEQSVRRLQQAVWEKGLDGLPETHLPSAKNIDPKSIL